RCGALSRRLGSTSSSARVSGTESFFLSRGREDWARLIYQDMQHEPLARLQSIHQELLSTAAEFWEFTDRGENFYYLEPALWPYAEQFFRWFQGLTLPADKLIA
ncbi:hypothetical protein, partial [Synechococcus sp. R55.2]|uniref:hypothetical protein n=1 Tax=Synechococcus sp. R55.2 TaxID=2964496 RepID=UPI0039C394EB